MISWTQPTKEAATAAAQASQNKHLDTMAAKCRVCASQSFVDVHVPHFHDWEVNGHGDAITKMICVESYELCPFHYSCLRFSGLQFFLDGDEIPYPINEVLELDEIPQNEGDFLYGNNSYEAWHDFCEWIDKGVDIRKQQEKK